MPLRPTSPMWEGVLIDGMATHDTDPHRAQPPFSSSDEGRTEPGDAPTDEGSSAIAESLLADLARAPLPADNVRETEGHAAAAYAVAPHRPPRANEKTIENAAVVVETTAPVPVPLPVSQQETTVPGGARLLTTMPSERARTSRRVLFASIGGAVVAAAIAVAVVVFGSPTPSAAGPAEPAPAPPPSAAASAPSASVAPTATATATATATVTATATASITTSSTTTAAPRTPAKAVGSARPTPPASARPSRPSGNFAEPDRSF